MGLRHLRYFCAAVDHVKADLQDFLCFVRENQGRIQRANGN
jgi:hypothetical protein